MSLVAAMMGEFQMIRLPGVTEHDSVKTRVIGKRSDHFQAQAIAIKAGDSFQIIRGTRNAQLNVHD